MSTQTQPTPIPPQSRLELIDVIRGLALFGVLAINMSSYSGSFMTESTWSTLDHWLTWLQHFLIEAKFYSIFSFLFGLGMALQLRRAADRGTKFVPLYLRRVFWLLLFGLAHATLLWTGDILALYAVCGTLLLAFRRWSPKALLIAAGVALLHPLIISLPGLNTAFTQMTNPLIPDFNPAGQSLYVTSSYFQVTALRWGEGNTMRLVVLFTFGNIFAMFLLGLYAGRKNIFARLPEYLPLIRRVLWWSLALGVLLNGLYVLALIYPDRVPDAWGALSRRGVRTLAAPTLCFFYITAIILLYQRDKWRQRLNVLAPLGRMALTNYLLQSLVMTTIFYGYGLGFFGMFSPIADLVLTVIFYALQIQFSAWWLEHFRFGPAEWCWRSLTYNRLQPFRLDAAGQGVVPSRFSVTLTTGLIALLLGGVLWQGWQNLSDEEQTKISGNLPTPTLALPTPRPTPTPTPLATPVVAPMSRQPGLAASRGDLWDLSLAFDPALALAEIDTLAGPLYHGRLAGSPGGQAAGDYIARRFAEYGLRPAGINGSFFQPFTLAYIPLTAMPRLSVTGPSSDNYTYRARRDFAPLVNRYLGSGQAAGPVVWANTCVHDDFDAVDVVNKVVLCWNGRAGDEDPGRNALEHGAAALLLLVDPQNPPPLDRRPPNRAMWVPRPIPAARIAPAVAADLLAGSGLSLDDLTITSASGPLSTTASLAVTLQADESTQGRNVLGVLPGRDPRYASEVVILGAHYDHVGVDPDGTVWPGANDNASGTATLLEIARSWRAQGYTPRRTVLFAAWDAEEVWLNGSTYYVTHPQYPLTRTIATFHLDMVGADGDMLNIDGTAALAARTEAIAHTLGISTVVTADGSGSDHAPFFEAGIPANLLIWVSDTETPATIHYHRPSDTPAIIQLDRLAAAGRVADLTLLALVEGEPDILDVLQTRQTAVNTGVAAAFLSTGLAARRDLDAAWFGETQKLTAPRLTLSAANLQVTGRVATATVQMKLDYVNQDKPASVSASLPVSFIHQDDGWRWAGPALIWQQSPNGLAVASSPEYTATALELSELAASHYAHIAGQLGLPTTTQASLVLYPDESALRADTRLTLPSTTDAYIERGGSPPLVKLVFAPHLSQTQRLTDTLVQLALADAGMSADAAPWLWQGLPLVYYAQADPLAADYLPNLSAALMPSTGVQTSPATTEALAWAAVDYLREQVGWAGIGQLARALGRGASPDEALTTLLGVDTAGFESRWRGAWQNRLQQAQTGLAVLLAARQQAVLTGDEAAFLRTVDPADPTLLAEERAWLQQAAVEQFELTGQPLALLEDGGALAGITMKYKLAGDKTVKSLPLTIKLTSTAVGYRWAGPPFATLTGPHFTLRYPPEYAQLAQNLQPELEAIYGQVAADLQVEPDKPLTVKLYADPAACRASIALTGTARLTEWTAPGESLKIWANAADPAAYRQPLARAVAQALLPPAVGQVDWFRQGLAIYEAGRVNRQAARDIATRYLPLLDRAARRNLFLALDKVPNVHSLPEKEAEAAAAQSWDLVRYLADTYGQANLPILLRQVQQGQSFAQAFTMTYGLSLAEFESRWRESVQRGHAAPAWIETAQAFDVAVAERHLAALTHPENAGRPSGSPGEAAAAAYIAQQFAAYGLTPAGDNGAFLQRFPISYTTLIAAPRLWLVNLAGQPLTALRHRQDFRLVQAGDAGAGQVENEVIWLRGEDYGATRLAGKVVLRVPTGPVEEEIKQALAHGAGGLLLVGTPSESELLAKALWPVRPNPLEKTLPVVELTDKAFQRLLVGTGYTPGDLNEMAPALPLPLRVRLEVPLATQQLTSANVLGLLPGRDPALRDEIIIIGAHYDHVGDDPDDRVCLAVDGTCEEWPGFKYPGDNNASGVAVMLELARLWLERNYQPARSVLFAAWGGHEAGEVGSRFYVTRPTLPLTDTVALFQLEAVGGGGGFYLQTQADSAAEEALGLLLAEAADQIDARWSRMAQTPLPGDHEPFRRAGIPALFVSWEKATQEHLPALYDDEIVPLRLGQTGRAVTLAVMMAAQ